MKRERRVQRVRDLVVVWLSENDVNSENDVIVVGCDSAGGIGPKERDVVRVPAYVLGRFTSRVALMEVLASGATPSVLVSTLCVEPEPAGVEITRGIMDELSAAGLGEEVTVTGSSEKNIPTCQTGLGITVIGFASGADLRLGSSRRHDELFCVGVPKVGAEVSLSDPEIADIATLRSLLAAGGVHEVVPAGSRGILHEAQEIAVLAGLSLELRDSPGVSLRKSAGPATCLIVSAGPGSCSVLVSALAKPVFHLGWLR